MVATRAGASGIVIRVLVVSPQSGVRRELERVVARDPGLRLIGACESLASLDGLTDENRPDVVLLGPGPEAQRPMALRLEHETGRDATPLVVLLDDLDRNAAAQALRAGARAALPHHASPLEIGAAIRGAMAGLASVPAAFAISMLDADSPDGRGRVLTPREREILTLLGEGLVNKEIAVRLGVSEHTVKTHLAAIYEKLDASNRAEAVATGLRRGLIML